MGGAIGQGCAQRPVEEDRDPIAGTPHHKDVHVRLEAASPEEAAAAEEASARVGDLIAAGTAS